MSESTVSQDVLAAAKRLAERQQLGGASMADIAKEAGITRVTLYRRGETRAAILVALRDELAREERERLLPVLTGPGDARTRLTAAFEVFCAITDERADLMAGLDDPTLNAIYHDPGDDSLTRTEFTAPIVRLLRDGALDGSLRPCADPDETATVLYVQVCETYRHLRREHRWSAKRATDAVLDLALHGLLP
ncbi:TetR/AcrR family transcriptional regulator [Jiangella sp. DSM 45060]|uniref:TetR/AcrR family transcriptional regulator n=1 Tax=Jiangella sp. DSM 45060 TaxID=1798224 RepID=UPI00087CD685|nr:TetR/AcrR family transcriptional regulator [Jiangella sp. DSM 45060]SDT72216.1 DNA-binding transcriptional regulator, AcrR family [Jiangella sp. DSM 45060]